MQEIEDSFEFEKPLQLLAYNETKEKVIVINNVISIILPK